jgi:hypothetical protein
VVERGIVESNAPEMVRSTLRTFALHLAKSWTQGFYASVLMLNRLSSFRGESETLKGVRPVWRGRRELYQPWPLVSRLPNVLTDENNQRGRQSSMAGPRSPSHCRRGEAGRLKKGAAGRVISTGAVRVDRSQELRGVVLR